MTPKKASLPSYLKNLPDGISVRKLRGGRLLFTIKTDLAEITCKYDPQHIEERLEERVADLFERARTGEPAEPSGSVPDFTIFSGSNLPALIEVKGRNVRSFGSDKYSKYRLNKEGNT